MLKRHLRVWIVLFAALFGAAGQAAEYPARPVTLVVGFPPGGAVDIMARTIGQKLGERLGQPVVIENRPGAGGNIGAFAVTQARPDGYTLLISAVSSLAISPSFYRNLNYNPETDLAPVGLVGAVPNVLVVNPKIPATTVKELIALAKAKPGTLNFGSAGAGTTVHFSGELFKMLTHTDMVHVPYRGAAPAMADLLGGQVDLMFDFLSAARPHIASGALRALGVSSAQRSPLLPDVPTIAEAGVPGYEVFGYFGIFAPAGTPKPVIDRLNQALTAIVAMPEVKKQLAEQGALPASQTPEELQATVHAEIAQWAKVVEATGARSDN